MFYGTYKLMMDRYKPDLPQPLQSDALSGTDEDRRRNSLAEADASATGLDAIEGSAANNASTGGRQNSLAA